MVVFCYNKSPRFSRSSWHNKSNSPRQKPTRSKLLRRGIRPKNLQEIHNSSTHTTSIKFIINKDSAQRGQSCVVTWPTDNMNFAMLNKFRYLGSYKICTRFGSWSEELSAHLTLLLRSSQTFRTSETFIFFFSLNFSLLLYTENCSDIRMNSKWRFLKYIPV